MALSRVTGDFNPTSIGLKEHFVKHKTGLTQIITVLDWLQTNKPKFFQPSLQLSKIGRSDHYAVLVKHNSSATNPKAAKKTILRRNLRESAIIAFGIWITSFEWGCVLGLQHAKSEFETFYNILISAVNAFLPMKKIRICSNNKPWVNQKLTTLILEKQKALFTCGKDSAKYKQLRKRVQRECKVCKQRYYQRKV